MKNRFQKVYTINLIAVIAACIFLLVWLFLSLFSVFHTESRFIVVVVMLLISVFLPFNLFLGSKNKTYDLQFPINIPKQFLTGFSIVTFAVMLIIMVYGIVTYTEAPIEPVGSTFRDKVGNEYSPTQYRNFQKWEITYVTSWALVALPAIALLPFYDSKSRTWRY